MLSTNPVLPLGPVLLDCRRTPLINQSPGYLQRGAEPWSPSVRRILCHEPQLISDSQQGSPRMGLSKSLWASATMLVMCQLIHIIFGAPTSNLGASDSKIAPKVMIVSHVSAPNNCFGTQTADIGG